MLSVKNVSIVRVERKKFIFQNLPLDKSHFITEVRDGKEQKGAWTTDKGSDI